MGSVRKWLAVFLTICVTVSSMGINAQAQGTAGDGQIIEQESSDAEEHVKEEDSRREEEGSKEVKEEGTLNFLMLESTCIQTPGVQNLAVSLGQESMAIERAELTYRKAAAGESFTVETTEIADNMAKFTMEYTDKAQSGIYELVSVRYQAEGREYEVFFADIGMEVSFGVNQESDSEPDELLMDSETLEEVEANVVTMDENGNTVSEQSIKDVLQDTETVNTMARSAGAVTSAANKLVIVLDPGHDSVHAGARSSSGLKEEELALKIAQYCKAELQKYSGVTVYMTRTSNDCPNGGYAVDSGTCNAKRVEYAVSKKADVYVSLHLNSSSSTSPRGVGVYYPNSNYRPQIGEEGKGLATDIYKKLSALGLPTWAGGILIRNTESNPPTLYPDGSKADYLAVIRRCKEAGIPAVLVEHAFLSNAAEVSEFLSSNAKLKKLGVADAQGIASYYGLSLAGTVPEIEWTKSVKSQKLRVSWSQAQGAVSYQVYRSTSADGKYTKVAEVSQTQYDDGSVKAGVTYYYKICAVFSDGETSSYSKVLSGATLARPKISKVVSKAVSKLKINWGAVSGATKYEVWRSEASNGTYTKIATTTENTYTDSNVQTQKDYFYKIRARGGEQNGCSTHSVAASGWAVNKTAIRNVSSADSTSLRIRWNKVENAYLYRIQRSTSKKGKYKKIADVSGNKTSYVDRGLKEKKTYYYKIQVINRVNGKNGLSGYCSAASGKTITGTSMAYVKSNDSNTMELKWKKVSGAYAYSIKRSRKKNGTYEKIAEIRDCNITQYQDKNIVSGKRYYYVVEVIVNNKGIKGYSGDSKPATAVSLQKVNISSVQEGSKGFLLNWEKAPGANCYEIMRSTRKSGGFKLIAKVRGTEVVSFTDENVVKGTQYYYRIRAVREGKRTGYGSYGKVAESSVYKVGASTKSSRKG